MLRSAGISIDEAYEKQGARIAFDRKAYATVPKRPQVNETQ